MPTAWDINQTSLSVPECVKLRGFRSTKFSDTFFSLQPGIQANIGFLTFVKLHLN